MEDQFSYDEEQAEEREVRRKKLALKEQVASAKSHLDGLKSKYYKEIQYGSKLTSEQQKAIDFFNRYNKESQEQEEVQPEAEAQEAPVLEEITEEEQEPIETTVEEVEEAVAEAEATGRPLPENIQKLMDFMEDTGGDLSDYVKLNQDYSKLEDQSLLNEY